MIYSLEHYLVLYSAPATFLLPLSRLSLESSFLALHPSLTSKHTLPLDASIVTRHFFFCLVVIIHSTAPSKQVPTILLSTQPA